MTEASAVDSFPPSRGSSGTMAAATAIAVRPPALFINDRRLRSAGWLVKGLFLRPFLLLTWGLFLSIGSASCEFANWSCFDILGPPQCSSTKQIWDFWLQGPNFTEWGPTCEADFRKTRKQLHLQLIGLTLEKRKGLAHAARWERARTRDSKIAA